MLILVCMCVHPYLHSHENMSINISNNAMAWCVRTSNTKKNIEMLQTPTAGLPDIPQMNPLAIWIQALTVQSSCCGIDAAIDTSWVGNMRCRLNYNTGNEICCERLSEPLWHHCYSLLAGFECVFFSHLWMLVLLETACEQEGLILNLLRHLCIFHLRWQFSVQKG